jgi:hypothetical protein
MEKQEAAFNQRILRERARIDGHAVRVELDRVRMAENKRNYREKDGESRHRNTNFVRRELYVRFNPLT